jgi:hypothetical protein
MKIKPAVKLDFGEMCKLRLLFFVSLMEIRFESRDLHLHREIIAWIGNLLLCSSI